MMPTIDSMKMIGMPASVSATKITPNAMIQDAPTASRTAASPQTTAPMTSAPARAPSACADAAPALCRQPGRPGGHRRQVVQGDEVVADRHRDDRVEPRQLERRRRAGGRELAGRVLGRAPAAVEQQHRQADPGEGAHRALPPGRPGVGDEGDHRDRAALDAQRDAEPDRPEEGEARQLLGAEERVAEGVAGEDVARQATASPARPPPPPPRARSAPPPASRPRSSAPPSPGRARCPRRGRRPAGAGSVIVLTPRIPPDPPDARRPGSPEGEPGRGAYVSAAMAPAVCCAYGAGGGVHSPVLVVGSGGGVAGGPSASFSASICVT